MTGKFFSLRPGRADVVAISDEALLAACGTGDLTALDTLFLRFHIDVYRFVGRLLGIDELARDDLVQGTFLEARQAARRFRGTSSVKTWILGIAANLARHHLRSERRLRDKHARYGDGLVLVSPRPDEQIERRELLREIAQALASLPPDLQIAFILCDLEEIPGVEVARAISIPQGTLWRRLHVARKAMRAAVKKATQ
jgi:RNA polymerase sigma-70 factor (ECF subfamily)